MLDLEDLRGCRFPGMECSTNRVDILRQEGSLCLGPWSPVLRVTAFDLRHIVDRTFTLASENQCGHASMEKSSLIGQIASKI